MAIAGGRPPARKDDTGSVTAESDHHHARVVVVAGVTSLMVAVSTSCFAWSFSRFVNANGYLYCVPVVVYATVWMLVTVFAVGISWSLAEQVGRWMAKPPTQPGPTPPPDQPKPQDTKRPYPSPIQPPRPHPPTRAVETTLVDVGAGRDLTLEMPVLSQDGVGRRMTDRNEWWPQVAPGSKERVN